MTAGLELVRVAYDDPAVVALVADLQRDLVVRYGGPDETPVDPGDFAPPRGVFLLGRLGRPDPLDPSPGPPVACGGWRRDGDVGEVKRVWVDPAHRRRGHARALLRGLEDEARAAGLRRLRLETGAQQPEALALYAADGWGPIPGFGHYADEPGALSFGKELADPSGTGS